MSGVNTLTKYNTKDNYQKWTVRPNAVKISYIFHHQQTKTYWLTADKAVSSNYNSELSSYFY